MKLLIRWQGYDESERTWEPLAQVYEDVEVMTQKYVDETDHPTLTQALDRVIDDQLPDLVEASSSDSDDEWSYKWVPGGYYGYPGKVNSLLVVLSDAQDHGGSVLDLWICDDGQTIWWRPSGHCFSTMMLWI